MISKNSFVGFFIKIKNKNLFFLSFLLRLSLNMSQTSDLVKILLSFLIETRKKPLNLTMHALLTLSGEFCVCVCFFFLLCCSLMLNKRACLLVIQSHVYFLILMKNHNKQRTQVK